MASKENQDALDTIYKKCNGDTDIIESLLTLQKAIDDLELYKKAIHIAVVNSQIRKTKDKFMEENCMKESGDYCEGIGCVECIINKSLDQARKELENANH